MIGVLARKLSWHVHLPGLVKPEPTFPHLVATGRTLTDSSLTII